MIAPPAPVRTRRLELIAADAALARTAAGGADALRAAIPGAPPAPDWPPALMADALEPGAAALADGRALPGWSYWFVLTREPPRAVIGIVGLKGRPGADGRVDIGYAIVDSLHKRGYGTEATRALIDWAFAHPEVAYIIGETLDGLTPSIRVMERCGFRFIGRTQGHDPGDPEVLQYRLDRPVAPAR